MANLAPLRAAAARHGISLHYLLLAACATSLARADPARPASLIIAIYLANRPRARAPSYPTLALVPLVVTLAPDGLLGLARRLHRDVQRLVAHHAAQLSLAELYAWTGLRVDCFVNVLPEPLHEHHLSERVVVDHGHDDDVDGAEHAALQCGRDFVHEAPWMRRNAVRDAYIPSLDIETSVKGNELTVGVFGARQRLSQEQAANLVKGVVASLNDV